MKYQVTILATLLAVNSYAVGLQDEIDRFKMQVAAANRSVVAAADRFKASYIATAGSPTETTITISHTNGGDKLNPVASIRYGFIDAHAGNSGNFSTGGIDNVGMYGMEVTFKANSVMSNIHPSLDGRKVLFLATGPDHHVIYTSGSTAGFANLADSEHMSQIGGFICRLKTLYGSATDSGSHPVKNASTTAAVSANTNGYPGQLTLDSQKTTNLFAQVMDADNIFSACGVPGALFNDMAASSASGA